MTHGDGSQHRGPAHSSPYPVSRLSAPHELVSLAEEIARAEVMLGAVVGAELEGIARRIRALQDEARALLEATQRDARLHRAACNFVKRPGRIYHLYERADGTTYFSMLSLAEWGGAAPHAHRGSYRLEADMRWTPTDQIAQRDAERARLQRLLPDGPD